MPICQAGGSPRGQAFAARWADTIIANARSIEAMKTFREDVRRRAAGCGRDPDSIRVLFLAYPIVDTTSRTRLQPPQVGNAGASTVLGTAPNGIA